MVVIAWQNEILIKKIKKIKVVFINVRENPIARAIKNIQQRDTCNNKGKLE